MSKKILHIGSCDKFLPPFIEFIKEHFDFDEHQFYLTPGMASGELKDFTNVIHGRKGKLNRIKEYWHLIMPMHKSKKIILHGLFNWHIVIMLLFMPWLLKKCYWVIWGGDLYSNISPVHTPKGLLLGVFRRFVIRRIGGIVTMIEGDYELARKHFGTNAKCYSSFVYPSNIVNISQEVTSKHDGIYVLVGNSADPSNHHFDVLDQLAATGNSELNVIAPLSYGDRGYAQKVIARGKELFGNKFSALQDFMPRKEYEELLKKIDIAIFNHDRQQALGNIITLLGFGKKVYIRNNLTHWDFFVGIGVSINNISDIKITVQTPELQKRNQDIICQYFNSANLIKQLDAIFRN